MLNTVYNTLGFGSMFFWSWAIYEQTTKTAIHNVQTTLLEKTSWLKLFPLI